MEFYHQSPLLSVLNVQLLFAVSTTYNIMYNSAFSVPRSMKKIKSQLVNHLKSAKLTSSAQRALLSRSVGSIRLLGIRTGQFGYLQRTSTPKFVDFCVKNVVRLSISYRKSQFGQLEI